MTQEDIDLFMESVDIGYTRCNIQPIACAWLVNPTIVNTRAQCCGMMAAIINKNGLEAYEGQKMDLYKMKDLVKNEFNLSALFFNGFVHGFDGDGVWHELPEGMPEYMSGYQCGRAKRKKWIVREKQ
jgi:hypothetical protein